MTVSERTEVEAHLSGLESIWEGSMSAAYAFYRATTTPEVAFAAALVESALGLQHLGAHAPDPPRLLLGDLCLARASRMLAITRNVRLQVGFARAVELVAAAAAGGPPSSPLRDLLTAAIGDGA